MRVSAASPFAVEIFADVPDWLACAGAPGDDAFAVSTAHAFRLARHQWASRAAMLQRERSRTRWRGAKTAVHDLTLELGAMLSGLLRTLAQLPCAAVAAGLGGLLTGVVTLLQIGFSFLREIGGGA